VCVCVCVCVCTCYQQWLLDCLLACCQRQSHNSDCHALVNALITPAIIGDCRLLISEKRRASFRGLLKVSKESKDVRRSPDYFIEHLRSCNDPMVIVSLCHHIRNESEPWLVTFAQLGGISSLFGLLQPASACKYESYSIQSHPSLVIIACESPCSPYACVRVLPGNRTEQR
jgi:hypothetical protein